MDEIVRKSVNVKMVLDVIDSQVVVHVQLDFMVQHVNLLVDRLHMDFTVLKHVIVQQKHPMVVTQHRVNVDVNLVIRVIDVK